MSSFLNNLLIVTTSIIAYSSSQSSHNNSQYEVSPNHSNIADAQIYEWGEYDNINETAWQLKNRNDSDGNGWLLGLKMSKRTWGFQDNRTSITTINLQGSSEAKHGVIISFSFYNISRVNTSYWSFMTSEANGTAVYPSCGNAESRSHFARGGIFEKMGNPNQENKFKVPVNGNLSHWDRIATENAFLFGFTISLQYQLHGNLQMTMIGKTSTSTTESTTCYYSGIETMQNMDLYITADKPDNDLRINKFILNHEITTKIQYTTNEPTPSPTKEPTTLSSSTQSLSASPTTNTETPTTSVPTTASNTGYTTNEPTSPPTPSPTDTRSHTSVSPTTSEEFTSTLPSAESDAPTTSVTLAPITNPPTTSPTTAKPTNSFQTSIAPSPQSDPPTTSAAQFNNSLLTTDVELSTQETISSTIDSTFLSSTTISFSDSSAKTRNLNGLALLIAIVIVGGCLLCTVLLCIWLITRKKIKDHDHPSRFEFNEGKPRVINKQSNDNLPVLHIATQHALNSNSVVSQEKEPRESSEMELEEERADLLSVAENATEVDVSSFNTPGNVMDRDVRDLDVDDIGDNMDGHDETKMYDQKVDNEEEEDMDQENEEDMYEDDDVMNGDVTTNNDHDNIVLPDMVTKDRFANADEVSYNGDEDENKNSTKIAEDVSNAVPTFEKKRTNDQDEGHY